MITLKDALAAWLQDRRRAVVSDHELALAVVDLYRTKTYEGDEIGVKKDVPEQRDITRSIRMLLEDNILSPDIDLTGFAYRVRSVPDEPAEAVICTIDPLTYVSHLSAMQRHGLTERDPTELSFSRPAKPMWQRLVSEHIADEIGSLRLGDGRRVPRIQHAIIPERVRKRVVQVHETRHPGSWQLVRDANIRVATIGQTFADMLARPQWCGGMAHVLEVWGSQAVTFLEEIIEAVERAPIKLVKVRAGYILEERLGLQDARVENWTTFAQRGGSQVLDPEGDYLPIFSEKWMISVNVKHAS